jgi:hypothetical protein
MHRGSRKRNRVFLSYSHKDEVPYLDEFRPFLKSLADLGRIDFWSDRRIEPSEPWHQEIQGAIESAAVLLVSQDFLASDYIREHEVPPLFQAQKWESLPERNGVRSRYVACRLQASV